MSLITRCPTCETMFKVVPDQLRVSEGWVRCGHCAEIFDANQNMVGPGLPPAAPIGGQRHPPSTPAAPPPPAPRPDVPARPDPAPPAVPPAAPPHVESTPFAQAPRKAEPAPDASPAPPAPQPAADEAGRVVVTAPGVLEPMWSDAPETDPQTALTDPPVLASRPAPPRGESARSMPDTRDSAQAMPKLSFLQDSDGPSFWHRRSTRIVLVLLLAALLVALGVQILLGQRDRIAAFEPSSRPILLALCAWQGCTLAPLRQIESVVIDSSSFSRIGGDDYRLGFSLKNNAPVDVAMPAIELALTDPQDQPVVRRVILPSEFGADTDALASASVWNGSIALNVKPVANVDRIAGYRLLAFYP